jgi:hypothetical protein
MSQNLLTGTFLEYHLNFLPALLKDAYNYFFRLLILVPLIIFLGIFKVAILPANIQAIYNQAYIALKKSSNV